MRAQTPVVVENRMIRLDKPGVLALMRAGDDGGCGKQNDPPWQSKVFGLDALRQLLSAKASETTSLEKKTSINLLQAWRLQRQLGAVTA